MAGPLTLSDLPANPSSNAWSDQPAPPQASVMGGPKLPDLSSPAFHKWLAEMRNRQLPHGMGYVVPPANPPTSFVVAGPENFPRNLDETGGQPKTLPPAPVPPGPAVPSSTETFQPELVALLLRQLSLAGRANADESNPNLNTTTPASAAARAGAGGAVAKALNR